VSDVASQVKLSFKKSLDNYLEPRLELLLPEIENLHAVSDATSIPVDLDTIRAATQFAYSLPRFDHYLKCPQTRRGKFRLTGSAIWRDVSVSVNKQNRLAYAGWFGEKAGFMGLSTG